MYKNTQSTVTDETLILRIQQGDGEAFELFYERNRANMYLSAYHLLRDKESAHDAVQELFMEIWQRSNRIQSTENVKGYLYTILIYL